MRRAYPQYRESGVEWLGEVPAHWDVRRLKWSIDNVVSGVWGDKPDGGNETPCIRVADFDRQRLRVRFTDPTMRSISPSQLLGRELSAGHLLLEKSGGGEKQLVGCVVLYDHDESAVCSNFIARMSLASGMYADFWNFLHAALYAGNLNYTAIKQTTGIQNLDTSAYFDLKVAFPPQSEQRAIAAFLDCETERIDGLVAKNRLLIERLAEYRTALITRAVTRGLDPSAKLKPSGVEWLGDVPAHWGVRRLHRVCRFAYGDTLIAEHRYEGDVAVFGSNGALDWHDQANTTEPVIVIGRKGSFGQVKFSREAVFAIDTTYFVDKRFTCSNLRWLYYVLLCADLRDVSMDSAVPGLSREHAYGKYLPLPPAREQCAIADYLDRETERIDALTSKAEAAIERLQEYRAALITAAVTGKIDVREPEQAP